MFESQRANYLLERADLLARSLDLAAQQDAEVIVAACGEVFQSSSALTLERKGALRRVIRDKSEVLARRGARGMPLAALGRAALAELAGAQRDVELLLAECEQKMAMFGY